MNPEELKIAIDARRQAYWQGKGKKVKPSVGTLTCNWCKRSNVTVRRIDGKLQHDGCEVREKFDK